MGQGQRRTWSRLHLCVDEASKDIVAVDLTTSAVHDSPRLPKVLDRVEGGVGQVSADGAYDSEICYAAIPCRGAVPTIPPRRNARFGRAQDPPPFRAAPRMTPSCVVSRTRVVTAGGQRTGRAGRSSRRTPFRGSRR